MIQKAIELHVSGKLDEAAKIYREIIKSDNNINALYNLSLIVPTPNEAISLLKMAVSYAPEFVEAHLQLSALLRKVGLFDEADYHYMIGRRTEVVNIKEVLSCARNAIYYNHDVINAINLVKKPFKYTKMTKYFTIYWGAYTQRQTLIKSRQE